MRTFIKRAGIAAGILFTAVLCMGIVYIDNIKHYFYQAGGLIQFVVNTNVMMTVDTNNLRLGINTTNGNRSVIVQGRAPNVAVTGNGLNGSTIASVQVIGGNGGVTTTNSASNNGGAGGAGMIAGGDGGSATNVTGDTTFGSGGVAQLNGGTGGSDPNAKATNSQTYGNGGGVSMTAGAGGANLSGTAPTNAVGGSGGIINVNGGTGGSPGIGWSRKPGAGGAINFTAGSAGLNAARTNGAVGGAITFTAGSGGNVATGTGDGGIGGDITFLGGAGAAGAGGGTNANGGAIYLAGGSPASGAIPGPVIVGITSGGSVRGKTGIGMIPGLESEPFSVRPNSLFLSNTVYTNLVQLVPTNSTAVTNLVIDYAQAYVDIYLTNNATFTNWVNMGTNRAGSVTIFITIPGSGTNTLTWPTLGAPSFGVKWFTNANAPMFTSATGGQTYAFSDTWRDTNHHVSLTVW